MASELLTTEQAAGRLGVTAVRVRVLIQNGRLKAEKFGHMYMIQADALEAVAERRAGWPKGKLRKPENPTA